MYLVFGLGGIAGSAAVLSAVLLLRLARGLAPGRPALVSVLLAALTFYGVATVGWVLYDASQGQLASWPGLWFAPVALALALWQGTRLGAIRWRR